MSLSEVCRYMYLYISCNYKVICGECRNKILKMGKRYFEKNEKVTLY